MRGWSQSGGRMNEKEREGWERDEWWVAFRVGMLLVCRVKEVRMGGRCK